MLNFLGVKSKIWQIKWIKICVSIYSEGILALQACVAFSLTGQCSYRSICPFLHSPPTQNDYAPASAADERLWPHLPSESSLKSVMSQSPPHFIGTGPSYTGASKPSHSSLEEALGKASLHFGSNEILLGKFLNPLVSDLWSLSLLSPLSCNGTIDDALSDLSKYLVKCLDIFMILHHQESSARIVLCLV